MKDKKRLSNAPAASTAAACVRLATQGQVSPAAIPTRAISITISVKKGCKRCPVSSDSGQGIRMPSLSRRRLYGVLRKRLQKKNETGYARFRSNRGDAAYAVSPPFHLFNKQIPCGKRPHLSYYFIIGNNICRKVTRDSLIILPVKRIVTKLQNN